MDNVGATVEGINDSEEHNEEYAGWAGEEVIDETVEDEVQSVEDEGQGSTDTDKVSQQPQDIHPEEVSVVDSINIEWDNIDVRDMSKQQVTDAKQRLEDLQSADKARVELHSARNKLESFILDYPNKLLEGSHFECSTETERTHLLDLITNISSWYYGQSDGAKAEDFKDKLNLLTRESQDISDRAFEFVRRPLALNSLNKAIESTYQVLPMIKQIKEQSSSYFTDKELKQVEITIIETKDWRDRKVSAQEKLKPFQNPVLLTKDIVKKMKAMKTKLTPFMDKIKRLAAMSDSSKQENVTTSEPEESVAAEQSEPSTEETGKTEL